MTLFTKIITLTLLISGLMNSEKSTVYLVGDSTVRCGDGTGSDGLWGWGSFLVDEVDTSKVSVVNKAMGGRSSRTYIQEGRWNSVHDQLKAGDFVIIQFGHNDAGPINDDFRARGTIKGNGEETEQIDNILTGRREIIKSFGWYLRKYIADTKAKGAIPIVCSLVARNQWENGQIIRNTEDYTKWAKEASEMEGAFFIDLNDRVATRYEEIGQQEVSDKLFLKDHTHTNMAGAKINAALVANAIKNLDNCALSEFIK